jgi:xanthine dehydrogenase YagS FAD-binding subunit
VALDVEDGAIRQARVAVGGVATVPWRLRRVEEALAGRPLTADVIREAAARSTEGAQPHGHNAFKMTLLPRTVERALRALGGEGGLA